MKSSLVTVFFLLVVAYCNAQAPNPSVSAHPKSKAKAVVTPPPATPSTEGTSLFIATIQTIKRATVAVTCMKIDSKGDGNLTSIEGSGFFTSDDGTFITAGHVAHGLYLAVPPRKEQCETPAIYFPKEGWKAGGGVDLAYFKIRECKWDDDLDLAVCDTVDSPFSSGILKEKPTFVTLDTTTQAEGTDIAFTGFPLSTAQPITARGTIATYWGMANEDHPRDIVIDHSNWPGASGGPVYLANGKVIGLILKRGMNDAAGLAFARSAISIESFLAKNRFHDEQPK
jgi:hypothetical protein